MKPPIDVDEPAYTDADCEIVDLVITVAISDKEKLRESGGFEEDIHSITQILYSNIDPEVDGMEVISVDRADNIEL